MTEDRPRARVGTSGWKKDPWRGNFYPKGLPQQRELKHISGQLTTLEVNTTFHGDKSPSIFLKWWAETPDDFVFSVKGSQVVTHNHSLRMPSRDVARFIASGVPLLKKKLGVVLWQVEEHLRFDPTTVEAFLAVLPHSVHEAQGLIKREGIETDQSILDLPNRPIRHAFEVRHESFNNPAFFDLLRHYDVAAVVTNTPKWPEIREITSDFVYVRLHGDAEHYPRGYDRAALEGWAELIDGWRTGRTCLDGRAREVFVYFDNPDHLGVMSPFDARKLQFLLDGPDVGRAPMPVQLPLF